jgi:23S rRNA pseudouridine2457 synthase
MLSQFKDQNGLTTLNALTYEFPEGTMPVGRLDYESEGLLLLTTDKNFYKRVLLPENKIDKAYLVRVKNKISEEAITNLRTGVEIALKGKNANYQTKPCGVVSFAQEELPAEFAETLVWPHTWLKITISEGKNRQIRKMCSGVGYKVQRLIRVQLGTITLKDLKPGQVRVLTPKDLITLL